MKCNNTQMIGIPEGEENEQGIETLFGKKMTKNFPNLEREKSMQVQEAQRVPITMNPRGHLQDISKLKCQILKTKRES